MSTSDVLRLEEYRGRRERRLRRTLVLNRGNPARRLVLESLADIADAFRADRVVAAWLDEYGGARAHPWAVLDLAAHPPRRGVDAEPLIRSWKVGVPAMVPEPGSGGASPGPREWAVSLGSDGLRLWFVVVEPGTGAPPLTRARRESLMFLAGECGAVLLHQDMDMDGELDGLGAGLGLPGLSDRPEAAARDALLDLAYFLVEEDMVPEPGPLEYQLDVADRALPLFEDRLGPSAVVDAARCCDPAALTKALVKTARSWERSGSYETSGEAYRLAYEAACRAGACAAGGRAARGYARALRRLARWDQALVWYDVARAIARAVGNAGEEAVVLDGMASVQLGRGRVPAARTLLEEARRLARRSGDPEAVAAVRFSFMTVAHTEGRLEEAAIHGWEAFRGFRTRTARLRALTALGGVFLAGGQLDSAEDAFAVVERDSGEAYYRRYALAGLARVQAARGDREAYETALRRLDEAGMERSAPELRAEALLERGDGYRQLGDLDEARRWYREAMRVAKRHRVNEYLIRADLALDKLNRAAGTDRGSGSVDAGIPMKDDADVEAIRRDLGDLRRSRVGVGGSPRNPR